ncbi:hypothetical protein GXP67_28900 [Rhodocytophaga rosea]|uniref:Uncharacterized protein n=1 Tax=Rhodocytophaga rosea TaxID=2704465 RepID=A0A6C0GQN5_9BACT|nr:hypothetical protein [Rhodocytophaga rosea]QHT70388.1 hypothetical protein GXP67_28900 [Rhodocytophaga rosea]
MKVYYAILFISFLTIDLWATDNGDMRVNQQISLLQTQQVDTIIIHKYALFNGRFHIPTENKELFCESIPYVYHIIWKKNGKLFCKRIDDCSDFVEVPVKIKKFDSLIIAYSSTKIDFKKSSAHFSVFEISVMLKNVKKKIRVSGHQINNDTSSDINKIKQLNMVIRQLEEENQFKRI